jgi:hypothetical protein
MYTSLGLAALAGLFLPSSLPEGPAWRLSYTLAREEGQRAGKPLAVVVGSGKQGFDKLSTEGQLSRDAQKVLASTYVAVYLDLDNPQGRKIADQLGMTQGIVISDRGASVQAFRHDGTLSNADIAQYLRRYADPSHVVTTTERPQTQQTVSYYPPAETYAPAQNYVPAQSYAPAIAPSFGGFGGGRAANC